MKMYYRDVIKHLLTALYELPDCRSGGIAHIVTDDYNVCDDDLDFVLKECEDKSYLMEAPLVKCLMVYLKRFTHDERFDIINEWWKERNGDKDG